MFYWAQNEYQADREYDSIRAELELFVAFMLQRGVSITFAETTDEGTELLWSNCGILVNDSGIIVRDYADYALPPSIDSSNKGTHGSLLDPTFLAFLEAFTKRNRFESDIAFDVRDFKV